ncbi:MAG: SAM-dependent methyltransferase [Nocardioidaceae bacterium]|nr:SAM-dependent methyltransferase [Nocardioidaceae bacterium]MCL2615131.1 SAM-dependent methyltransferase [Nocardioidaceae bacterium]
MTTTPAASVRAAVLDSERLVRAVVSGRRRGHPAPEHRRVELRWVDLRAGRRLQVVRYDATQAHTANFAAGPEAEGALDALLDEPFGNWHVETTDVTLQLRYTKKGAPLLHRSAASDGASVDRSHDRDKDRLLPDDDPVFAALGLAGKDGRIKPSRQAKHRQVEEFLRLLDAALSDAVASRAVRRPTTEQPLRIVDLGCGNGYLTFAAQRYLAGLRGLPVRLIGVDVKEQSRDHNSRVAAELGIDAEFVVGTIAGAELPEGDRPDVVLALHACDTATDEALARAVGWEVPLVLAAPCCHHDIAAQIRRGTPPSPYAALVRDGILRERFADTLTDALRALLMRSRGYRVEVVQFVESQHTPRNTMLRAVRAPGGGAPLDEYAALTAAWGIRPRLGELLGIGA